MKHENEINKLLSDLFREKWMDDDDWSEMLSEVFRKSGLSIERLSIDIEIGIKNGYSVEQQIEKIQEMFNKYYKDHWDKIL